MPSCPVWTPAQRGPPAAPERLGQNIGKLYGIPANNEAMMLICNKDIVKAAGLDPNRAPATWDELADYSKQIHDRTGKYGYGLVGALNNGNTPFRFCPTMWAYGGQIFDELAPHITWKKIGIDSPGTVAALELYNRMFNVDKSVQPSALTHQESDVGTLFLDGKLAIIFGHPNAASQVKQLNPKISLGAGRVPRGSVLRAVVFGGCNLHVNRHTRNLDAVMPTCGPCPWGCSPTSPRACPTGAG